MTKAELVSRMADDAGITRTMAESVLNGFIAVIGDALASGEKITLVGFGTFEVVERSQREGRNPRTGDAISIPASKAVRFKVGSKLKESVL